MLGDKLRELRERRDVKQTQISAYLKVGQNTYSRWENNERKPDYETLVKIAEYYNVSTDYLLNHNVKSQSKIQKLYELLNEEQKKKLNDMCKVIFEEEYKKIDF